MAPPRHMHLHGTAPDHAAWSPAPVEEDDFDGRALEEAMIEAREEVYRALATIDAA